MFLPIFPAGVPRPNVTWYLENSVIDDSHHENDKRFIVNRLVFPRIGRQHVNARLICMASNSNLLPSVSKVLVLDVNCKCSIEASWSSFYPFICLILKKKLVFSFSFYSTTTIGSNTEQTLAPFSWKDS